MADRPTKPPAAKPKSDPAKLGKEAYLREQLREIHTDIDTARRRESFQAVAALRRQAKALREELDELVDAKTGGRPKATSPAEYLERLTAAANEMPDQHLEVFVRAYCDRHGITILGTAEASRGTA